MTFSHRDDYVTSPRSGGYRALHLHAHRTVTSRGQELGEWRVEIQLRTERQHEWADEVEGFDEAAQTDVKHETAAADVLQCWADRASLLAAWDADRDDAVERQRLKQSVARMRAVLERVVHGD